MRLSLRLVVSTQHKLKFEVKFSKSNPIPFFKLYPAYTTRTGPTKRPTRAHKGPQYLVRPTQGLTMPCVGLTRHCGPLWTLVGLLVKND